MGEKAGESAEQALTATQGGGSTATATQSPVASAPEGGGDGGGGSPLAEVNVSIDPQTGKPSVKFAYVCLHCGGPRDIETGRYGGTCPTCGQTSRSGNNQLDAVARGEHVPTYDRTSTFYP